MVAVVLISGFNEQARAELNTLYNTLLPPCCDE